MATPTPPRFDASPQDVAWREWVEQNLIGQGRTLGVVNRRARGAVEQASTASTGVAEHESSIVDLSREASIPQNLRLVSSQGVFQPDGRAVSEIKIAWDPVTADSNGKSIDSAEYEVWTLVDGVFTRATSTTESEVTLTVQPNVEFSVAVRARPRSGQWGAFSALLELEGDLPAPIASPPTQPMLTTGGSGVFVIWDGMLTTGATPAGGQGVFARYRVNGGAWNRVAGPIASGPGQVGQVRANPGDIVDVELVLVDTLGRTGGVSAQNSIETVGTPGDHIIAGSIAVDRVEPAFGEQLQLSANGSIQLIVQTMDDTNAQLALTQAQAEAAATDAASATSVASSAQAGLNVVEGNVSSLQSDLVDTANQVQTIQTWFWVDVEGAHVGRSDSPFQAHVKSDRFEITENGVVQTWWSAGQMNVPSAVVTEMVLANHKIENYGSGTVVRAL